jgi:hypothetical protein
MQYVTLWAVCVEVKGRSDNGRKLDGSWIFDNSMLVNNIDLIRVR